MDTTTHTTEDRSERVAALREIRSLIAHAGTRFTEAEVEVITEAAEDLVIQSSAESVNDAVKRFETLVSDLASGRCADMVGDAELPGTLTRLRAAFSACGPALVAA